MACSYVGAIQMQVKEILVKPSSPEEWLARASDMFNSAQYRMAQMCAERGGDITLAARCDVSMHNTRSQHGMHALKKKSALRGM